MLNFYLNQKSVCFFKKVLKCLYFRLKKTKLYLILTNFKKKLNTYIIFSVKRLYSLMLTWLLIYLILYGIQQTIIQIISYYNFNKVIIVVLNDYWISFNNLLKWGLLLFFKTLINFIVYLLTYTYQFVKIIWYICKVFIKEFTLGIYTIIKILFLKISFYIKILLSAITYLCTSLIKSIWFNNTRELLNNWFDFSNKETELLLFFKNHEDSIYIDLAAVVISFCIIFLYKLSNRFFYKKYLIYTLHFLIGTLLFYLTFWILITTKDHDDIVLFCILMVIVKGIFSKQFFYDFCKTNRICLGLSNIWLLISFSFLVTNCSRLLFVRYILQKNIVTVISYKENDPIVLINFRYIYCSNYAYIIIPVMILLIFIFLIRFYIKNTVTSFLNIFYWLYCFDKIYKLFCNFCNSKLQKFNNFLTKIKYFLLCEDEINSNNPYLPVLYKKKNN